MRMMVKFIPTTRTDRRIALLLFAGILGLYMRTMAPGLLGGDSGEFQVAAWTLGLAHPTGYPLYLLLGSLWQHLLALFGVSPAYALNLLSALFGALAVALLYLVLICWLQSSLAVRRLSALLAALLFAVNPTFWSQSLIAEVYTLHALFVILILHTAHQLLQFHDQAVPTAAAAHESHVETTLLAPLSSSGLVLLLALLLGFALTHHAMTLVLLPSIIIVFWWSRTRWGQSARTWLLVPLLVGVPLALYFYIPLRSGPGPSPWYHQLLGAETLSLYQNNFSTFWYFITGQSISVGFRNFSGALDQLSQAWLLWRLHFFLPGLVMIGLGLYVLWRARNWRVLALTVPYFILQQGFNLFYAIGDILVYYIPLYLIAVLWIAFTADAIGGGLAEMERKSEEEQPAAEQPSGKKSPALAVSLVLIMTLLWLPFEIGHTYFPQLNQSAMTSARQKWDAIVAAAPSEEAILISNDRNEIVPLFYYQAVENKLIGRTGLFPLIEPGERFTDIGATVTAALAASGNGPVYLIKAMPGLDVRFDLQPATPPLIAAQERTNLSPEYRVNQSYGPLTLLGFDQQAVNDDIVILLYWQVDTALSRDYTTTVQLFDALGEKIAQHDALPGGLYYPTSLWKLDEVLIEEHSLSPSAEGIPTKLLINMYDGATMTPLASSIEISLLETEQ